MQNRTRVNSIIIPLLPFICFLSCSPPAAVIVSLILPAASHSHLVARHQTSRNCWFCTSRATCGNKKGRELGSRPRDFYLHLKDIKSSTVLSHFFTIYIAIQICNLGPPKTCSLLTRFRLPSVLQELSLQQDRRKLIQRIIVISSDAPLRQADDFGDFALRVLLQCNSGQNLGLQPVKCFQAPFDVINKNYAVLKCSERLTKRAPGSQRLFWQAAWHTADFKRHPEIAPQQ